MSKIETLMKNAHVHKPEDIHGYLLGINGTYNSSKIPRWMDEYRVSRTSPPYDFMVPWNTEETRSILERIRDEVDDDMISAFAQWGLDALDEQASRS